MLAMQRADSFIVVGSIIAAACKRLISIVSIAAKRAISLQSIAHWLLN
jgi:hypothetical protein